MNITNGSEAREREIRVQRYVETLELVIQPFEVESIFNRLKQVEGYSELKCLLVPIRGQRDLGVDLAGLVEKTISEMAPGELKTLSI